MRTRASRSVGRPLLALWLLWGWSTGAVLRAQEPGDEFLTVEDHPDTGELVLALGPIDLPAQTGHERLAQLPVQGGRIPFDLMVHGYRVEAVDREGRPVSHAVIHHFNMLDPSQRELFLPVMRRLFASGQETDSQEIPAELFGLPLQENDPFLLLAMLHNPTDRSYEGVTVRLVLSYSRTEPLYRVFPFHMDAMFPLGSKAFDLPPGRTERSWVGRPAIGGAILGMGGHLHRYAESLTLEDVTEGKVLYRVVPEESEEGYLLPLPVATFLDQGPGLPLDPTHEYRVTATYFNPSDETIVEGGMGSIAGAFIPSDEEAWPAADPADPLYATDYRNVLASTTALGPGLRSPSPEFVGPAGPAAAPDLPEGRDDLIELVDHPEERVLEMVVGPAALRSTERHLRLPIQLVELPLEGWLHGFEWEITDAEGKKLPDALLHHVNLIDPDRRELFSPIPRRVLAIGAETARQELPRLLGYPVETGTRLLVSAMFARPTGVDYDAVYLRVRLFYTDRGQVQVAPRDVYPFYLDVMGPVGRKSFTIPPGGTVRSWTASPAVDGRIVAVGAHLHDRARLIRLEDLTAGEVIWETEPVRDETGRVTGVPTALLWGSGGVSIYKEHRYRLVVEYENPTDRPDPEPGMGEIGGLILVAADAEWPPLDRSNPAYVADLTNTLEAPVKIQGH